MPGKDLVIGLVNIMPRQAMQATERHFNTLLRNGIGTRGVQIKLFTFQPKDVALRQNDEVAYQGIDALSNSSLDGLIVTGTEPSAATMTMEPHWKQLAALVDWAAECTISTIWSCFSAHAAVFRLDKIVRQALPEKLSGVFECVQHSEHAITSQMPKRFLVPHSRYNTLSEDMLNEAGYTILSRSARTGPDMFVKRHKTSEFLFFQGHPEYGQSTLLGEYARDVARFAAGRKAIPSDLPENYFEEDSAAALRTLTNRLRSDRTLLDVFNWPSLKMVDPSWEPPARLLYAGWLSYIAERKSICVKLAA